MDSFSGIAGRHPTPSNPFITVTQHPDIDTPLPSTELPGDDRIEAPDPTERHQIRNSPYHRVNGRAQAPSPYTNTSGLDWRPIAQPSGTSGGLKTFCINQNVRPEFTRSTTSNPSVDWYTAQERPWNNPFLPQAYKDLHTPLSPLAPLALFGSEDSGYPSTYVSGTGRDLYSSLPRSVPAPAYRTYRTPRPHGTGTKVWSATQSLPEPELRDETPRYPDHHGSHRKRSTDVESVNAYLDATKAKKPLKKLLTSCTSCSEEKIRCDQKYPRCGRCERLGVVCNEENP